MRLLIISPDFKPNTGGIAEYIHNLAEILSDMGKEIEIISYDCPGSAGFDLNAQMKIVRLPLTSSFTIRRWFQKYFLHPIIVLKHLHNKNYDFVFYNSIVSPFLLFPLIKYRNVFKWGSVVYGLDIFRNKTFVNKIAKSFQLNSMDIIITISSYTKKKISDTFSVKLDKIKRIPPAISANFVRMNISKHVLPDFIRIKLSEKKVILCLGRLVERKGFDRAICAMNTVKRKIPESVLLIVGEGPYESKLKLLAKERGLLGNGVEFLGYISDEEKHYLYSKSDIYLMPSRELENGDVEGFGIVFLEANAYGLPVIGGNSGGIPDAIIDEDTGYLVDPLDEKEIAIKIIHLLENDKEAKEMGARGKKRLEKLTWRKAGEKFYAEIIRLI